MGVGITAFFPAYNDAPSLPALIGKTFRVLETCTDDFEVVVVNDGSQDGTAQVLEMLVVLHGPRLRVVTHPVNRGYGGALQTGFHSATRDLVFYTDGDGQYDVGELPLLLRAMGPGVGLANGYKLCRHDPWHRIVIGRVYNQFARFLFGIRIRDIDCDFRLIRRDLLQGIHLQSTSGTICVELVRKVELSGCGVAEIGVSHLPRLHGRSQFFRWRSLFSTLRQLLILHWTLVAQPWAAHAVHRTLCAFRLPTSSPK
jgi:glycosyltransferase involved in cell wall biosynthesis